MRFCEYKTQWTLLRKLAAQSGACEVQEFYARLMKATGKDIPLQFQWFSEVKWLDARQPFYKVYPAIARELLESKLTVNFDVFRVPHNVFSIHLSDADPISVGGESRLRSLLVCADPKKAESQLLIVAAKTGQASDERSLVFPLNIKHGAEIEGWIASLPLMMPTDSACAVVAAKLAISVCLLAVSQHRLVQNEVLESLREKFVVAKDQGERESIVEKSKRRGVFGWTVGRDLPLETVHGEPSRDIGQRQLTHQHERGGHWHTVCRGPGRGERVAVYYERIVVRPDLPKKEIA